MSDSIGQGFTASIVNGIPNFVAADRSRLGMANGVTGAIQYVKLVWGESGEANFVSDDASNPSPLPVSLTVGNDWLYDALTDTTTTASGATAFRVKIVDGAGLCFGNISLGAGVTILGFGSGATNASLGVTFGPVSASDGFFRMRNWVSGAGVTESLSVTGGVAILGGTVSVSNISALTVQFASGITINGITGGGSIGVTFAGVSVSGTPTVSVASVAPGVTIGVALTTPGGTFYPGQYQGIPVIGVSGATAVGVTFGGITFGGVTFGTAGVTFGGVTFGTAGVTFGIAGVTFGEVTFGVVRVRPQTTQGTTFGVVFTNPTGIPFAGGASGVPVFGVSGATAIPVLVVGGLSGVTISGLVFPTSFGISGGTVDRIRGGTLDYVGRIGTVAGGTINIGNSPAVSVSNTVSTLVSNTVSAPVNIRPVSWFDSRGIGLSAALRCTEVVVSGFGNAGFTIGAFSPGVQGLGVTGLGVTFGSISISPTTSVKVTTDTAILVKGSAETLTTDPLGVTIVGGLQTTATVTFPTSGITIANSVLLPVNGVTYPTIGVTFPNLAATVTFPTSGITIAGTAGVTFTAVSVGGTVGVTFGGITFGTAGVTFGGITFGTAGVTFGGITFGTAGVTFGGVTLGTVGVTFGPINSTTTVTFPTSGITIAGTAGVTFTAVSVGGTVGVTFGGVTLGTVGVTFGGVTFGTAGVTFGGVTIPGTVGVTLTGKVVVSEITDVVDISRVIDSAGRPGVTIGGGPVHVVGNVNSGVGVTLTGNVGVVGTVSISGTSGKTGINAATADSGIIVTQKHGANFARGLTFGGFYTMSYSGTPDTSSFRVTGFTIGTQVNCVTKDYNGPSRNGLLPSGEVSVPLKQGLWIQLTKWDLVSHVLIGYTASSECAFVSNAQVLYREYQVAPVWSSVTDQFRRFTGLTGNSRIRTFDATNNVASGDGEYAPKPYIGVIEKPSRIFIPCKDAGEIYIKVVGGFPFDHDIGSGFFDHETGQWSPTTLYERNYFAADWWQIYNLLNGTTHEPNLDSSGRPTGFEQYFGPVEMVGADGTGYTGNPSGYGDGTFPVTYPPPSPGWTGQARGISGPIGGTCDKQVFPAELPCTTLDCGTYGPILSTHWMPFIRVWGH